MAEMTTFERAARAVAIASDPETAAQAEIGREPFVMEKHRHVARAVLTAIREFTNFGDQATQAGARIIGVGQSDPLAWQNCQLAQSIFMAMIDAALAEEG